MLPAVFGRGQTVLPTVGEHLWNSHMRALFGVAVVLLAASSVCAQTPGHQVDATLSSGDVIRGVLVSDDGTNVVINHPVLGQLTLAKKSVSAIAVVPEAAPPPPPPPPPPPAVPEVKPDPDSFFKGWTGNVELGLNGSDGNTQTLSFRAAVNGKRETSKTVTTAGVLYLYGTQDGDKNQDRAEFNLRNDWKITPPWRIFAIGKAEYDTFQDWVWRTSAFAGLGYEFIKNDKTLLLGRFGAGITKEFGGEDNRIQPELDFGLDFEHKFDERSKVFASVDVYPSLQSFSDYRAVGKAGYEIVVDPQSGMALKLGAEDRYDATPGDGKKRNDITYFAVLSFNF